MTAHPSRPLYSQSSFSAVHSSYNRGLVLIYGNRPADLRISNSRLRGSIAARLGRTARVASPPSVSCVYITGGFTVPRGFAHNSRRSRLSAPLRGIFRRPPFLRRDGVTFLIRRKSLCARWKVSSVPSLLSQPRPRSNDGIKFR